MRNDWRCQFSWDVFPTKKYEQKSTKRQILCGHHVQEKVIRLFQSKKKWHLKTLEIKGSWCIKVSELSRASLPKLPANGVQDKPLPSFTQICWLTVVYAEAPHHRTYSLSVLGRYVSRTNGSTGWNVATNKTPTWTSMWSTILGGGVKHVLFSPPIWGRFPFWRAYFSRGLKPPTSQCSNFYTPGKDRWRSITHSHF